MSSAMALRRTTSVCLFFFNDTATSEIYTLSLHDALPIWIEEFEDEALIDNPEIAQFRPLLRAQLGLAEPGDPAKLDRKSTRLNSSHVSISYAVFCLKKKIISLVISCLAHSTDNSAMTCYT